MTRQRAYQIRNLKRGKCKLCPKALVTKNHCLQHSKLHSAINMKSYYRLKQRSKVTA